MTSVLRDWVIALDWQTQHSLLVATAPVFDGKAHDEINEYRLILRGLIFNGGCGSLVVPDRPERGDWYHNNKVRDTGAILRSVRAIEMRALIRAWRIVAQHEPDALARDWAESMAKGWQAALTS